MDVQLRDEAAQDRVRSATEFLDPSKYYDRVFENSTPSPANIAFLLSRCAGTQVRRIDLLCGLISDCMKQLPG